MQGNWNFWHLYKWAITDQFRDYLCYAPEFTVFTDNNLLTYVLTIARLNATGLRWIGELADFNFNIRYRPGKLNADADALSRIPLNMDDYMKTCTEEINQNAFQGGNNMWCKSTGGIISNNGPTSV